MNTYLYFAVVVTGFSGLIAQVLLLRELLVNLLGNELVIGIIFTAWIICEALGVFIFGKLTDKIKNKLNIFLLLQAVFSLALVVSLYMSRVFKALLGLPFGEGVALWQIAYASFLIMLLPALCHGALFSCACLLPKTRPTESIGKVYSWETLGTMLGGIFLTFLFLPRFNSFQIAFVVILLNILVCSVFLGQVARIAKYVFAITAFCFPFFVFTNGISFLQESSLARQWQKQKVLASHNSVYGNITVTEHENQHTFFYNGSPVISLPYPDISFVQEFGNLPLLFHKQPQDVLILSGAAGGLLNEILKHPVKKVDYLELDPLILQLLKQYPAPIINKELSSPRVRIIHADARAFLRAKSIPGYDIFLIGISKPQDLTTNRLFTEEFFVSAKKNLKPAGIFALWLPGQVTRLTQEQKDLNACILNGLKIAYPYIRVLAGELNIFLASESSEILEVSPEMLSQRLSQREIKDTLLLPDYLGYRLDARWEEIFWESMAGATKEINCDLKPIALFEALLIWNKQFGEITAQYFAALGKLNLKVILWAILVITGLFLLRPRKQAAVAYSIFATGFWGMLINLVLLFNFQVTYGYLYQKIAFLIAIFMAGIAFGGFIITYLEPKLRQAFSAFVKIEFLLVLFSWFFTVLLWLTKGNLAIGLFYFLLFSSGVFLGLEFPLASKIYLGQSRKTGEVVGQLYFSDLAGGALAGILGGVVFLPVLGLLNSCILLGFIKLSSLVVAIFALTRAKN